MSGAHTATAGRPDAAAAPIRGAAMMLIGCGALTVNDALMKSLVAELPLGQVVTLRGAIGVLFLLAAAPAMGGMRALAPRNLGGAAALTSLLIIGLFLFPYSLKFLPLADAIMLAYLSPIIVAALSPWALRERVGWRRWSAVVVGFIGAAMVIRPAGGALHPAVAAPLIVAFTIALRDLMTRRFIQGESALALVAAANLGSAVIGLSSLSVGWAPIEVDHWLRLAAAAAMLTLAQFLMVASFRYAEATVLSCLKFSSIVWAAALGWIFFAEALGTLDWIGAALIVVSGVVITVRTKKTG